MAIKSAGIDGCVQESCVLWSVCSGCGAMLTLLYNCQFFASNPWWAASFPPPFHFFSVAWEWSGGFCGVVGVGGVLGGCVKKGEWAWLACGYTSIFIWTHNWYRRTMLPLQQCERL